MPSPSRPALHRWGAARPDGAALSYDDALVPSARVAFCGDYVGERPATVEGAMLSGLVAADAIVAACAVDGGALGRGNFPHPSKL